MFERARELALIVGILVLSVQGIIHSARLIESKNAVATLAGLSPEP